MVLSTLHTTGSVESITRLQEMGVEPYLLADTLRGIVAQRLIRKICEVCKRPAKTDPRVLRRLELPDDGTAYFEGMGCPTCFDTGYRGRIGIYEILEMSSKINDILRAGGGASELRAASRSGGLRTLRMEGIRRAAAGDTSLREVVSATARG
jgi:type II secretory ATPase GspE/PulE/Tfp pilus assembly ATPase PilB-like protein